MVGESNAIVGQAQVVRHVTAPLGVGERRLARCRVEQAELRAELPRAPTQPAPRRLQADPVVPAHVGLVAHHAVHPVVGRDARSGEHDAVDIARTEIEITQQRVDRLARIAGVVLQAGKALLGRAADDLAIAEYGGRRAMRLTDPQDDHDPTIISATVTSLSA